MTVFLCAVFSLLSHTQSQKILKSRHPPACDFARRRRQTLPRSAELTLVQLTLVSDVLAGAEAELGAITRLQAGASVVTVALAHAWARKGGKE